MKRVKILIVLAILICAVAVLGRPVNVLVVKNYHQDQVLLRKRIDAGYTFTTLIKHSVHKSPVYEYYQVDRKGKIIIKGTSLQDLGWGVPSTFDYDFKFYNDMMVIENINKPIEFLPFRVSYIAEPYLILGGERKIDLTKVVDNYERVDVCVERIPYIVYLMRGETDVLPEESQKR